jgi:hypothetical protein
VGSETISDEQLLAWICGEADASLARQIEIRLADDQALSQRVFALSEILCAVTDSLSSAPAKSAIPQTAAATVRLPEVAVSAKRPSKLWAPMIAAAVVVLAGGLLWYRANAREELTAWVVRLDAVADESLLPEEVVAADLVVDLPAVEVESIGDAWISSDVEDPLSWLAVAVRESQLAQRGPE